jgi:hypothetical protein
MANILGDIGRLEVVHQGTPPQRGFVAMDEEERQQEIARLTELLERPIRANLANRAIYRWVLELLRNCMVVAALLFLARKSGNWWLWIVTIVSGFALMGYCYTYVENVSFYLLNTKVPSKGWRMHVGIGIVTIVTQLILVGITAGLYVTLDRIVTVQFEPTKGS